MASLRMAAKHLAGELHAIVKSLLGKGTRDAMLTWLGNALEGNMERAKMQARAGLERAAVRTMSLPGWWRARLAGDNNTAHLAAPMLPSSLCCPPPPPLTVQRPRGRRVAASDGGSLFSNLDAVLPCSPFSCAHPRLA